MKVLTTNYTFDASAKTVTFTDYNPIVLERVLLITNVTDGIIIYQFNAPAKGGTAATNVLTLEYDTTSMSDTDDLQIWYEDGTIEPPLTDTELRATAVDVNVTGGSITVGTVEITNDAGNPIPVNGTVSVNEPVSIDDNGGSITVDGPLTDVQLRATPVPVSGTVSVTEPVSVDDNGGSLTVDNAALSVTGGGAEATALRVTVASDSTGVLSVDDNGGSLTVDNAALSVTGGGVEASALRVTIANDSTGVVSVDDNGSTLSVDDGGGSITVDGSVTVSSSALPTGASTLAEQQSQTAHLATIAGDTTNIETAVQLIDDAIYTDGTGTPSKAIGIAGTDGTNPQIIKTDAAGELQVDVLTMPIVAVTQSGTWDEVGINDSGNSITVDDGGTTLSIDDGGGAITVDGTVAATQSGTWTEANSASIKTAVELIDDTVYTDGTGTVSKGIAIFGQDGTNPQAIKTDSNGELQVDILTLPALPAGTNNIGDVDVLTLPALPTGTNTIGSVKVTDGTTVATVRELGTNDAVNVAICDGSGNQITSFGGGTQYTEGDTDASITGTAMLMEGAANALVPAQGTAADGLLVNLGANNDVTVTGTVAVTQSGTWDEVGINDSGNSITVDDGGTTLSIDDGGSSVTVDNGGTFVTQENGAALTSLQLLDDAIKTDDAAFSPATDKVMMAGFEYDDTTPDSVNEGDAGAARMSANRNQYVQIRDNAGNERGLNIDANGALAATVTNATATNLKTQAEAYQGGTAVGAANPLQVTLANGSVPSHAVTNAGTFAVQDSEKIADNAGFTDGTTKVLPVGYIYDEVAGTALTENDAAAARINANRAQVGVIEDGSTRGRYATVSASNALKVDGSAVTQPVSISGNQAVNVAQMNGVTVTMGNGVSGTGVQRVTIASDSTGQVALAAGTNGIGKLTANSGVDIGDVDVTSIIPGTGATNLGKAEDAAHTTGDTGVFILGVSNEANTARCADGDYSAIATDTEGNVRIVGNRDHDAVDAGEPVKVGQKAIAHGANPTAVAAADRTDWYANRAGIPFVIGGHPNIVSAEYYTTGAQTDDNILPAIAAGTIYVITGITVTASAANTVSPSVRIGFGTASVPTQGASGADAVSKVILSHPGIPAGSGIVKGNGGGIVGIGGDGEELRITCSAPTTGSLIVQVDYYTISS